MLRPMNPTMRAPVRPLALIVSSFAGCQAPRVVETCVDTLIAPGFRRLLFATARDGRIAIAGESDRYEITITAPDGTNRTICRSPTVEPLRPDEIGEEVGDLEPDDPRVEAIRSAPRPDRPAPVGRLFFGSGGRLWLQRDRSSPLNPLEAIYGRAGARYDVFDAEGSYLGEVQAPERARLVGASADRVWSFEAGPFDTVWVVAYRLETARP